MLDNFLTEEFELIVVLLNNTKNIIDRTGGQLGSFKESRNNKETYTSIKKRLLTFLRCIMRKKQERQ